MMNEKINPSIASKWFKARKWAHGLDLEAHKSTDSLEFFFQYSKNPECWDKAFAWLENTDVQELKPGKFNIDDDRVFVIVNEGSTKKAEDAKWEAHQKYIDIQYVVYGKEKMGVAPLSKAVGIEPFNQDKDIGFYEIPEADCKYYTAEPGYFFIFFPNDAHRPSIAIKGHEKVKKIVIKVRVF
jgi:YhcH/YjgK/YiaL family protein